MFYDFARWCLKLDAFHQHVWMAFGGTPIPLDI
jgi:hypothetical protein